MKKHLLWRFTAIFFIIFLFLFFPVTSLSKMSEEDCKAGIEKGDLSDSQLNDECIPLIKEKSDKYGIEIKDIDGQIKKYELSINLTEAIILRSIREIQALEEEINSLDSKIFKLDLSLDQLSEILAKRIAETYKKGKVDFVSLFLSSQNFSDFLSRFKYLRVVQLHDRSLMVQLETARTNFNDQKTLKEQKQKELEIAKSNLKAEQNKLTRYKKDQENLKALKVGEKKKVDSLLAEARAQTQRFKTFTVGYGVVDPVNIQDDWGKHYSQRDSRWAYFSLGDSSENILSVGCLVTSVAMIFTHYGYSTTPADIAANSSNFYYSSAWMNRPWVTPPGKTWVPYGSKISTVPESWIKDEVAAGHPVIVGLNIYGGSYADHFVVIRGIEGDNLMMNDPLLSEANIKLRDKYPTATLMNAAAYH